VGPALTSGPDAAGRRPLSPVLRARVPPVSGSRVRLLIFALAWLATACGASYQGRVYRGGGIEFRTGDAPAGWRQIDAKGALLTFRDDANDATIAVGGRCGRDAEDVPLEALTSHLFLRFTDREPGAQRKVALDGREALRTEMSARLDGVRKGFVVYVLKKDGCVYDFLFITDAEGVAKKAAPFDRFVEGFRANRDAVAED